jgi:hypothetical protein
LVRNDRANARTHQSSVKPGDGATRWISPSQFTRLQQAPPALRGQIQNSGDGPKCNQPSMVVTDDRLEALIREWHPQFRATPAK